MHGRASKISAAAQAIVEELGAFFSNAAAATLFTGAGVSARAGLPTWKALVERLAESIRSSDPLTTQLMYELIQEGNYTLAADYFQMSRKMLEGDKRDVLIRLLSGHDATAIHCVAALPFKACLTTNFDRSILDAIAATRGTTAIDFRLGDTSFKEAVWAQSLFVARVHGAAEIPGSIVLSERQFDSLRSDEAYIDLLRSCFLTRNVLFIGFSFYDPAIRRVFEDLERKVGSASPGKHLALLPSDASSEFLAKANRLNIKVVKYDAANHHEVLWEAIEAFRTKKRGAPKLVTPAPIVAFGAAKRYLAACYARAKTTDSAVALRGAVAEGIIAGLLQEALPGALSRAEVLERLRQVIGVKGDTAEALVDGAMRALVDDGLVRKHRSAEAKGAKYAWKDSNDTASSLASALRTLAKSAQNRAYLQEGWAILESGLPQLESLFGHMTARRGWDLGAAFAAGKAPENIDIESLVSEAQLRLSTFDQQRLNRVLVSMFQNPTEEESEILGELGRVSFAVELAFQAPGSTLLHKAVLPSRLYFDASVLLPAIVEGHPLCRIYSESLRRLREAAASAATPLHLKVCKVYLNEVISHRRNAEDYYRAIGKDEFLEVAQSDAMYHGAANVNVFIGAYSNWVHRNGEVSFKDFLARVAPYSTEGDLRRWLERRGFEVVESTKGGRYSQLYSLLERESASRLERGKNPILIQHDALQLSILDSEIGRLERAILVTADRSLQEAVAKDKQVSYLTEVMISHVGLVQLIELLLGRLAEGAGLADLLWSARITNQALSLHSYLVTKGLQQYDEGISLTMSKIVESCTEEADAELRRANIDLEADDPEKRARAFKRLGSLERTYMEGMRQAVEKRRKDEE